MCLTSPIRRNLCTSCIGLSNKCNAPRTGVYCANYETIFKSLHHFIAYSSTAYPKSRINTEAGGSVGVGKIYLTENWLMSPLPRSRNKSLVKSARSVALSKHKFIIGTLPADELWLKFFWCIVGNRPLVTGPVEECASAGRELVPSSSEVRVCWFSVEFPRQHSCRKPWSDDGQLKRTHLHFLGSHVCTHKLTICHVHRQTTDKHSPNAKAYTHTPLTLTCTVNSALVESIGTKEIAST